LKYSVVTRTAPLSWVYPLPNQPLCLCTGAEKVLTLHGSGCPEGVWQTTKVTELPTLYARRHRPSGCHFFLLIIVPHRGPSKRLTAPEQRHFFGRYLCFRPLLVNGAPYPIVWLGALPAKPDWAAGWGFPLAQ